MRICPNCNNEYADDVKFCLEDGGKTVDKDQKAKDPLIGLFVDRDQQYQVMSLLGEGGMGKVYKGHQASMNRDVAIKTLHKELLDKEQIAKRFRREALAASKLKHANCIDVYTFGTVEAPGQPYDDMPYMVMEFVSGKDLTKLIKECGKLDEARTIKIMLQVTDVLEEAHNQGIVHRDLKPDNIVMTTRGKNIDFVKVLDFGIAKMMQEEEAGGTKLTKAGTVFGTPQYLSPEQASGTPVDGRSDIYSVGIILYEMLTGKVPFHADTAVGFLLKHVSEMPAPLRQFDPGSSVSPEMEAIVMKALSKDPAERQQTAAELGEQLRALQARMGTGAASNSGSIPVPASTVMPGGLPPGMVKPAGHSAPTMMPGGLPPGMVQNGAAPSATVMPGGMPPGMVQQPNASTPVSSVGTGTLEPMVISPNNNVSQKGNKAGLFIGLGITFAALGLGGFYAFKSIRNAADAVQALTKSSITTAANAANTPPTNTPPVTPPDPNTNNPTVSVNLNGNGVEVNANGVKVTTNPETEDPTEDTPKKAKDPTPTPTPEQPTDPTPAPATTVKINFRSKPKGATVYDEDDNIVCAPTPCSREFPVSDDAITVYFEDEEENEKKKSFIPNKDQEVGAAFDAKSDSTSNNNNTSAEDAAAKKKKIQDKINKGFNIPGAGD